MPDSATTHQRMHQALTLARQAAAAGEVPVAAILTDANGTIIARAHNRVETDTNPLAHAEMLVIADACRIRGEKYLSTCSLYVTLEPCPMCAAAIAHSRLERLYFAAYDPKSGGVDHGPRTFSQPTIHHRPQVIGGILASEAEHLLKGWFARLRADSLTAGPGNSARPPQKPPACPAGHADMPE